MALGVAGINAATKLVDNGYPGELITIIDMGKDPYNRLPEEVMTGMLGAGGWSDGKLTYHTAIGGVLSKYTGEEKAMELMDQVITNFKRFHPKPEEVQCSNPESEPEFIKPYFNNIRQTIADSNVEDFDELFKALYERASEFLPNKEGTVAMLVNDHQYKANFRIDKEINTMSLIQNLINNK